MARLKRPWGIAVTADNVFVTDWNLHALLQFRKNDCKLMRRTGTKGTGEGRLFEGGLLFKEIRYLNDHIWAY